MSLGKILGGIVNGIGLVGDIADVISGRGSPAPPPRVPGGLPRGFDLPGRERSLSPVPTFGFVGDFDPSLGRTVGSSDRRFDRFPITTPFDGFARNPADLESPKRRSDFGAIDVPSAKTGAAQRALLLRIVAVETFGRKTLTYSAFKRVVKDLGAEDAQRYMNLLDESMLTILANPPKRRGPFVSAKMVNRCATVIRRAKRLSTGMAKKLRP